MLILAEAISRDFLSVGVVPPADTSQPGLGFRDPRPDKRVQPPVSRVSPPDERPGPAEKRSGRLESREGPSDERVAPLVRAIRPGDSRDRARRCGVPWRIHYDEHLVHADEPEVSRRLPTGRCVKGPFVPLMRPDLAWNRTASA